MTFASFRLGEMKEAAHRAMQPFGQIPTYEEGDLVLFESGAIVFHIAERHAGLLPDDVNARARAITWMFAALNTVEPPIIDRTTVILLERDKPWYEERLLVVLSRIRERLGELSSRLGDADWLEGEFTAGDLLMVSVLRRLGGSGILDEYPNVSAYVARGEARPAFKRLSRRSWWFLTVHRAAGEACATEAAPRSLPPRPRRRSRAGAAFDRERNADIEPHDTALPGDVEYVDHDISAD